MRNRERKKGEGKSAGVREISHFCQRTESRSGEQREVFFHSRLVKVADDLAAALVLKSGMTPHP